jgi:hypothetical protein
MILRVSSCLRVFVANFVPFDNKTPVSTTSTISDLRSTGEGRILTVRYMSGNRSLKQNKAAKR